MLNMHMYTTYIMFLLDLVGVWHLLSVPPPVEDLNEK